MSSPSIRSKSWDCALAEEERLDELDPLRHLRHDDPDTQLGGAIVPVQPRSIQGETQTLHFGTTLTIDIALDASPGCGGLAWPAGAVLGRYLTRRGPTFLRDKMVLELGSGTGLVGLVAAKLGARRVCITDQASLLENMQRNVSMNGLDESMIVAELNWGEPIPSSVGPVDILLAADCVYFEPTFPLLVQTLSDLVKSEEIVVLFCYKKRRKADKHFFTLLKRHFTWSEVLDDPEREVYGREAISLLQLRRRLDR